MFWCWATSSFAAQPVPVPTESMTRRKRDAVTPAGRLPVLLYHSVSPRPGERHPELTVTTAKFVEQMALLARKGFVGIRASAWLAALRGESSLPRRPILITFDDAYASVADHALPILAEHGFSALVFVISQQVGGRSFWDDEPLMSREQILDWRERGIEFGSHTRTHPRLPAIDMSAMRAEIAGSADDLLLLLGSRVESLAYPYGDYDERVVRMARANYDLAFTTEEGINDRRTDRGLYKRPMILPNDSILDFLMKVRIGWSPWQKIKIPLARARRQVLRT